MAETINPDDYSRSQLNQLALEAGLTDVERYQNKPAVADAINRVRAGEDAGTVNAEFAPDITSQDNTAPEQPQAADQPQNGPDAPKASNKRKKIYQVNGGHPTKFDETGNPVYDPKQV